jgi:hypothetical protein
MSNRLLIAIVVALFGGGMARAQGPAFTGRWTLDAARSVLHEAGTREVALAITDKGASVEVTQRIRSAETHFSCTTDRKPCESTTRAGDTYSRRLRRENGMLVWEITMTRAADKASITYTERWSLSDEGRTLTVHRVYPTGREVMQVFARRRS